MRTLEQTTQEVLDLAAKHFQLPTGSLAPGELLQLLFELDEVELEVGEALALLLDHAGRGAGDKRFIR